MKNYKSYFIAAGMLTCIFMLASGCTEQSPQTVKLALKLTNGLSETYRLQTVYQKQGSIEGTVPENLNFQGGRTTDKIEMVFDQLIQSVDEAGNATEKITIKELKYFAEVRNKTALDFDSLKDKNPNNALFALIGQSYTLEITPSGKISKIIDVNDALAAIKDIPSNFEAAKNLLSDIAIKRRHSIPLPDSNDNELGKGGSWSNIKEFNFGEMGYRTFERKYTLKKIEKADGSVNAIIDMSAIPSVERAKESYQERGTLPVSPMTDISYTYTGQMNFDVTNGTLIKYHENLQNRWLIAPPNQNESKPPTALNMIAIQSYDIEKINW